MPHPCGGCSGVGRAPSSTQGCRRRLSSCPRATRQVFRRDAYLAEGRQDLLRGVEDFLEASIVLPPTETPSEQLLRSLVPLQHELLRRRYQPPEKAPTEPFLKVPGTVGTTPGSPGIPQPRGWWDPMDTFLRPQGWRCRCRRMTTPCGGRGDLSGGW